MREAGLNVDWGTLSHYYMVERRKGTPVESNPGASDGVFSVNSAVDQKPAPISAQPRLRRKRRRTSQGIIASSKRTRPAGGEPIVIEDSEDEVIGSTFVANRGLDRPPKDILSHTESQVSVDRNSGNMSEKKIDERPAFDVEEMYQPSRERSVPTHAIHVALPKQDLPTPAPSHSDYGRRPHVSAKSTISHCHAALNNPESSSSRRLLTPPPTSQHGSLLPIAGTKDLLVTEAIRNSEGDSGSDFFRPPIARRRPLHIPPSSPRTPSRKLRRIRRLGDSEDNVRLLGCNSLHSSDSEDAESDSDDSSSDSSASEGDDVTTGQGSSPSRAKPIIALEKAQYSVCKPVFDVFESK